LQGTATGQQLAWFLIFLLIYIVDEVLAEWLQRLKVIAEVATVLGSVLASSNTVESEWRHEALLNKVLKNNKKSPFPPKSIFLLIQLKKIV
jgi:hypothetical protein